MDCNLSRNQLQIQSDLTILQKRIRKGQQTTANESLNKARKFWTQEEDQILKHSILIHGTNWKVITEYLKGRNASQCAQRWKRVKPNNVEKQQKWTSKEDLKVKQLVKQYKSNWKTIASFLTHRTSQQIRERYINHLDPSISKKTWSKQEDLEIWTLYQNIGSKWSQMAKKLQGRPENMIKNRFYGYIRKTQAKQENPYYIIPTTNRQIKDVAEKAANIKIENEITGQKFEEQQFLNKCQQNINFQQLEALNHFEIDPKNSKYVRTDKISQHFSSNFQEYQEFQTFYKQSSMNQWNLKS